MKKFLMIVLSATVFTSGFAGCSDGDPTSPPDDDESSSGFYPGYMLTAPLQTTTSYLIDTDGAVVHSWPSSYRPGNSAYLLEDGQLLRTGKVTNGNRYVNTGGVGGIVEMINWTGEVTWSYQLAGDEQCLHHDVEILPNGHVLTIAWELKSSTEAVAAGRNPDKLTDGELWPDMILEINPANDEVVWQWHVWDHLIQNFDAAQANHGVVADHPERVDVNHVSNPQGIADWTHFNSIDYNSELDQILVSVHGFDEVWVIDHSTTIEQAASNTGGTYGKGGDLLYRWGNPSAYGTPGDQMFFGQHDAQWITSEFPGAGNILVFNNGQFRPAGNYSTIDEIVPDMSGSGIYSLTPGQAYGPVFPVWNYESIPPSEFYGQNISGVQRQPNGNTLMCEGPTGRIFEVTDLGETVWSYQNPFGTPVFRAIKYPEDYSELFTDLR